MLRDYQNPCPDEDPTYCIRINNLEYCIANDKVRVREWELKDVRHYINYTGHAEILHSNVAELHRQIMMDNTKQYNWQLCIRPRLLWSFVGAMAASLAILGINTCSHSQSSQEKQNKTEIPSDTTQCQKALYGAFDMQKHMKQQNPFLQRNK